jgi:ankyrin repeat protein
VLLRHGASVGAADFRGCTALHYAASAGNTRLVQELLASGVSPSHLYSLSHTHTKKDSHPHPTLSLSRLENQRHS